MLIGNNVFAVVPDTDFGVFYCVGIAILNNSGEFTAVRFADKEL